MRVTQVSVLVSKKFGKNYCSWSLSYGATADVDSTESYEDVILELDFQLKDLIRRQLPHPGNGKPLAEVTSSEKVSSETEDE